MKLRQAFKRAPAIRIFLQVVMMYALLAGCVETKNNNSSPAGKPNILFILADDLGLHDLSYTGSDFYRTPNIDQIARKGTVFTQGYATSRVCSPSRASIMTGKFTARHGITDWIGARSDTAWRSLGRNTQLLPPEYIRELPDKDSTLAEILSANSYTTFFAGKWHLGDEGSYPPDHGFDINKGGWESGSPKGGYFSPWENPNLEGAVDGENLSMRLANETAGFIEKNKDKPFFAFLSFYAVHGPIQTTEEKWQKYRNKAESMGIRESGYVMERLLPIRTVQDNPVYAGLVETMDDAVGLVLNKLVALGLEKNTIVIFTSDNGGVASGDSFSTTNLPLRGGKGYQWEGGIREPYFIKVPWLSNNPEAIDYPVTGADFYPTILDLANIDLLPEQHVDGVSLAPLLKGRKLPERTLYWHYPHYGNQGGEPSSIIRKQDWKLIYYWEDQHSELYNLQDDPSEQNNLSDERRTLRSALKKNLLGWLDKVGANTPVHDPLYDSARARQHRLEIKNTKLPALEQERIEMLQPGWQPNSNWWGSQIINETTD